MLYDSSIVRSGDRWALEAHKSLPDARPYLDTAFAQATSVVIESACGAHKVPPVETYLLLYAILHACWHIEDLVHTLHVHGLPPPRLQTSGNTAAAEIENFSSTAAASEAPNRDDADAHIPGGTFHLGAEPSALNHFVFDSEKWAHPVVVKPFSISKCCVTNEDFARFVESGGYLEDANWSFEGLRWRNETEAKHPWHWIPVDNALTDNLISGKYHAAMSWRSKWFNHVKPLAAREPVSHVTWFEVEAYRKWAVRRLPTETEWELACLGCPLVAGVSDDMGHEQGFLPHKTTRHPWGNRIGKDRGEDADSSSLPGSLQGRVNCWNIDKASRHESSPFFRLEPVDALSAGDSAWGCRQMLGKH
jgi:iron(II)-dependent oxidoreductase